MRAGRLDRRITIQTGTVSQNALGEYVTTWADDATVWAEAMALRGREYFAAQQVNASVTTKFTIRWRALSPLNRILYDGKTYDIEHVVELGRRAALEIFATAKAP